MLTVAVYVYNPTHAISCYARRVKFAKWISVRLKLRWIRVKACSNLSITLDQVLHVPFDCVQMFLDVIEVLDGLISSHTHCITLVLGCADLLQWLIEGVSAETKTHLVTAKDPVGELCHTY